jgi:hypothetical protein
MKRIRGEGSLLKIYGKKNSVTGEKKPIQRELVCAVLRCRRSSASCLDGYVRQSEGSSISAGTDFRQAEILRLLVGSEPERWSSLKTDTRGIGIMV